MKRNQKKIREKETIEARRLESEKLMTNFRFTKKKSKYQSFLEKQRLPFKPIENVVDIRYRETCIRLKENQPHRILAPKIEKMA